MPNARDTGSQLPIFRIAGFTGHRQVEDPQRLATALTAAFDHIQDSTPDEWIALSSVAEGSDQLFVREALARGWAWHAILPLPRSEFARDFDPIAWAEVESLMLRAEQVQVSNDSGARDDAYLDSGIETVNGSDLLIAIWDGEAARGKGGTAEVVEYARALGRPLIIIDPVSGERRIENWRVLELPEVSLSSLNHLPDARMGGGENPFRAPDNVFAFQQKCDFAATHSAPGVRRMTVSTVLLHVLATFIAAAAVAYSLHLASLAWAKFVCLGAGIAAAFVLRRRMHSERSWVKCRLAAEFCRSALATWGLPRASGLLHELDLPAVHQLSRSLRILHGRTAAATPVSIGEFQRIYGEKRIRDQLAYYRRQEQRAVPLLRRLRWVFWFATITAMVCVAFYAVAMSLHLHAPSWLQGTVFDFLPIALPVVATAMISLISINDLHRRVARYRDMQATLAASEAQIGYCNTWSSLERVVLRTERALLQEVTEWHSMVSFSESH
jgi:ABC-type sugar transport system permease subunit